MQLILYAHFRNREAVAASQNGLPVAGKCTKNPAYLHRPCQNPEAPARHPLIDMRAELYAFARQGVRIASGVDSRIEIGMDFIRRHVQQGDYPIFRSFPHESQQAILGIVADFDEGAAPLPGSESRSIVPQSDQPPVELRRFVRLASRQRVPVEKGEEWS